jgi:hypothetical protein
MEPLDLKKFLWLNKLDKTKSAVILAITDYKSDDVVVYRDWRDRNIVSVKSVDDFCKEFEATYPVD